MHLQLFLGMEHGGMEAAAMKKQRRKQWSLRDDIEHCKQSQKVDG